MRRYIVLENKRVLLPVALGYADAQPLVVEQVPRLGVDSPLRGKTGASKGSDIQFPAERGHGRISRAYKEAMALATADLVVGWAPGVLVP